MEQETPPNPLTKPFFDELNLDHIQQYLDGSVKISFHDNKPLRINKGRHSFTGSEDISKRDQDLNEFLRFKAKRSTLQKQNLFLHIANMLLKKRKRPNLGP